MPEEVTTSWLFGMKTLNRRSFVQATALAAAGAATSVNAGQFTGKIRKAVKYHMFKEEGVSVLDKFKILKDLGYDGTEIRTADKVDPAEVDAAIEKTGFPVHGVIHSSNPDLKMGVDLAKRFGGDSMLVVARYDKGLSLQANWDRDVTLLRDGAPYAEKNGIKMLVENVWASYLISAFDMRSFLDEIDSGYVGSYFDVGNNVRWGVAEHWVELLGKRIGKLDIKEYSIDIQKNEGLWKGFGVPIGEGSVNWANVRAELAKIGFEGWATAEVQRRRPEADGGDCR